ncbi:MAG: CaiB/BaiF CoA transferase family protein [Variibacter sp.]
MFSEPEGTGEERSGKPLSGIRVLDLTRLLPGPLCAQHLADLGADVIKIEDTGRGDYVRPAIRRLVNRNKRAIRLDLKQDEGRDLLLRLVRTADVFIESFRPGVADRLGVGYDALRAVQPRLVYGSISGYGQTGPYRLRPGHDLNYGGYTGVVDEVGRAGEAPAMSGFLLSDLLGGTLSAAMGILAALVDAQRSGLGRHVDIAMTDSVFAHNVLALANLLETGRAAERGKGSHSGGKARYGIYATADGRYIALAAQEKQFWERFCELVGRPDFKSRHDEAALPESAFRKEMDALFAAQPLAFWCDLLEKEETCASPVLTLEEALTDAHVQARGLIYESATGPMLAFPIKMSRYTFTLDREPPAPGADTDEVLSELGIRTQEIAALRAAGVI